MSQNLKLWQRCQHLGLRVRRALPDQAQAHFLVDDSDQMMLEIYCNPADQVPDYPNMHPLLLHLARPLC